MGKTNRNRAITFLDHLYELDYKERPVSVEQFLCDNNFFGTLTDGGRLVYPIWKKTLAQMAAEDSKYIVVFTGAIGTGKTRAAIYGLGYVLHRLLCLKNPWTYFNKTSGGKMAVIFFNLTKSLGSSRGFQLLQAHLKASPWFCERGAMIGNRDDTTRLEFPLFEYKLCSPYAKGFGMVGEDVIAGIMDEVDSQNESEQQRKRIVQAYEASERRHTGRFVFDNESLGRLFLVASKQDQNSFLNTFIAKKSAKNNVFLIDIPVWEARPAEMYSGKKFPVLVGDIYTESKVLHTQEEIQTAASNGLQVIMVPEEYREPFENDTIGALRDFAGIAVSYLRKNKLFSSEKLVARCYDPSKKDPISKNTIHIGTKDTDIDLCAYINFSHIRIPKHIPRFIHVDYAYASEGDSLGIGMSCVAGWRKISIQQEDGRFDEQKFPVVETDFAMRLRATPGDQIPTFKVRQMIIDLKKKYGFNIKETTFDLDIATNDSKQLLEAAGIACGSLSMDKKDLNYCQFRDLVREQRWVCHKHPILHFELVNLDHDQKAGKVDHPDEVTDIQFNPDGSAQEVVKTGSKDVSDAVAGSVINALAKCKEPPDVDVMNKLYSQLGNEVEINLPDYWWANVNEAKPKDMQETEQKQKPNNAVNTYLNILKRSSYG